MPVDLGLACSRLKEAFPRIKEEWEKTAGGLTLRVISVLRTTEEQAALYEQGRTKSGRIVTNCDGVRKKSKHQRSMRHGEEAAHALDMGIFTPTGSYVQDDSAYLNLPRYAMLGDRIRSGEKWGDKPHLECI